MNLSTFADCLTYEEFITALKQLVKMFSSTELRLII